MYCDMVVNASNVRKACQTLIQSPSLAAKVRHFAIESVSLDKPRFTILASALRLLKGLLSLKIFDASLLAGCTFELRKLEVMHENRGQLSRYLNTPYCCRLAELTVINVHNHGRVGVLRLDEGALPCLDKVTAPIPWPTVLVTRLSLTTVKCLDKGSNEVMNMEFLTLPITPIRALAFPAPSLRALRQDRIAPILGSLERLNITWPIQWMRLLQEDTEETAEWIRQLLGALPNLRSLALTSCFDAFTWPVEEEAKFVTTCIPLNSRLCTMTLHGDAVHWTRATWVRQEGASKWVVESRNSAEMEYQAKQEADKQRRAKMTPADVKKLRDELLARRAKRNLNSGKHPLEVLFGRPVAKINGEWMIAD